MVIMQSLAKRNVSNSFCICCYVSFILLPVVCVFFLCAAAALFKSCTMYIGLFFIPFFFACCRIHNFGLLSVSCFMCKDNVCVRVFFFSVRLLAFCILCYSFISFFFFCLLLTNFPADFFKSFLYNNNNNNNND